MLDILIRTGHFVLVSTFLIYENEFIDITNKPIAPATPRS